MDSYARRAVPPPTRSLTFTLNQLDEQLSKSAPSSEAQLAERLAEPKKVREICGPAAFVGGLHEVVGAANTAVMETMQEEHTIRHDSRVPFVSDHLLIETTSETEFWFVLDPVGGLSRLGLERWPEEGPGARRSCASGRSLEELLGSANKRQPLPHAAFCERMRRHNEKLRQHGLAELLEEELIGGRLFTGPMNAKYQAALKALDSADAGRRRKFVQLCSDPQTLSQYEAAVEADPEGAWAAARMLCTSYSTTLHVIKSLLLRLSKLSRATPVYRALHGEAPPAAFWRERFGARGGVDPGFFSACPDRAAAALAARGSQHAPGVLLEIEQGLVSRGADLGWLSQYPPPDGECELVFPPHTALDVVEVVDQGETLVFRCRATVNRSDLAIDKVAGSTLGRSRVISEDQIASRHRPGCEHQAGRAQLHHDFDEVLSDARDCRRSRRAACCSGVPRPRPRPRR